MMCGTAAGVHTSVMRTGAEKSPSLSLSLFTSSGCARRGIQYASAVFYHNDEQKAIAQKVKKDLDERLQNNKVVFKRPFEKKSVTTGIIPATKCMCVYVRAACSPMLGGISRA